MRQYQQAIALLILWVNWSYHCLRDTLPRFVAKSTFVFVRVPHSLRLKPKGGTGEFFEK